VIQDNKVVNVFYVTNVFGNIVDTNVVKALRRELGHTTSKVKETLRFCKALA